MISAFTLLLAAIAWNTDSTTAVKIGAFNIRTFGVTKMGNPEVANVIANIVRRYDILLVQEVRDVTGAAVVDLLNLVNSISTTPDYDVVVSDRFVRKHALFMN